MITERVLVTDWGVINIPPDMTTLMTDGRVRKDGQLDKRFKTYRIWVHRFREETEKLRAQYLA